MNTRSRVNTLQARVNELEDMGPEEAGRRYVYIGGHSLRVSVNAIRSNTWAQVVSTKPHGKATSMRLGHTKRISFANAEKMGRAFAKWAEDHTMAECNDAAKRFREHAKTESGARRVPLRQLEDAWREVTSTTTGSRSIKQDRQTLARFKHAVTGGGGGIGGGGEGKAHRKLKEFVKNTPSVLGLPSIVAKAAETEFELPSGDSVDVMFCHKGKMIAVEVKPRKSKPPDIRRGLFQCVKYQAVTEAMSKCEGEKPNIRSVLVLGGPLPTELQATRKRLGVEVKENVRLG